MDRIKSFEVNHLTLERGLYVSRVDNKDNLSVTTFDLRFTLPNREPVMDQPAIHTIEHLCATFLRNSSHKNEIIYFGPMGCRTGFYLVMFGMLTPEEIEPLIVEMCKFVIGFEGAIPGASARECGNYLEQNLNMAKHYVEMYLNDLITNKHFQYHE